jgi:hypothetical protein
MVFCVGRREVVCSFTDMSGEYIFSAFATLASTLKTEAMCSSGTLTAYKTALCYNTGDHSPHFQSPRRTQMHYYYYYIIVIIIIFIIITTTVIIINASMLDFLLMFKGKIICRSIMDAFSIFLCLQGKQENFLLLA